MDPKSDSTLTSYIVARAAVGGARGGPAPIGHMNAYMYDHGIAPELINIASLKDHRLIVVI